MARRGSRIPDNRRPSDARGTLLRLLGYFRRYKVRVAAVVVMTLGSTLFTVVQPRVSGAIINRLYGASASGDFDWRAIVGLLILLAGIYVVAQLFSFMQATLMNTVTARVLQRLRGQIDAKVHRLPLSYYDGRTAGDILSVLANDVDMVEAAVSRSLTQLVAQAATAIGIFVMMLQISWQLTLVAVVMVPLSLAASGGVVVASRRWFSSQQTQLGAVNGYIEELYDGQDLVHAFRYQQRANDAFDALNDELQETARKANTAGGSVRPITAGVNNLGFALNAALGCMLALHGAISVGDVQAMLQYTRQFSSPFTQLAAMAGSLAAAVAAAERIFAVLDEPEEEADPVPGAVPRSSAGAVSFEHVSFGYTEGQTLMHDVSFCARPGQKVAIVGPTGAGKTTLVNLLMRFYEADGGSIRVDGVDTRAMTREELRGRFGMVLQDTWLFEGTIRDNLAYGHEGATDEQIVRAAKAASVDSIIRAHPGGYDMVLSPGAQNISQGERQLLTIARAIVSDPEVMILDEATSNVDARTEAVIQQAMARLLEGRTSFVIAHRLSTVRDADQILYMEHGDILETGTHDELMALDGRYAALYNSQFA